MVPLLVSVSTNEKSYNTTRADWFYTDSNGLKRDDYKSAIGYSNILNEWNNTSQATIKDDGQAVGSFVSVQDELSINNGVYPSSTGFGTSSVSTYSATFTPTFALFPGISLRGSVKLLISATFDVEAGTPVNLVCALKPTESWALRWTGIPQVDRVIFSSGREVWSFVQESVFDCPKLTDTLFDVSYDMQMSFTQSIKDTWRFGIKAIHNLVSSSWNNITLKPIAPVIAQRAAVKMKRETTPQHQYTPLNLSPSAPELDADEYPALYPELDPTNIEQRAVQEISQKKKRSLFGKLFKRKQKP